MEVHVFKIISGMISILKLLLNNGGPVLPSSADIPPQMALPAPVRTPPLIGRWWEKRKKKKKTGDCLTTLSPTFFFFPSSTQSLSLQIITMASVSQVVTLPLPALPEGWAADKDFKAVGKLSGAVQRSIEPVGPHFLAHARRARHKRTFSEDDRIQAQESAKNVEDVDDGDESEPEDPMMLQSQAKDWKVCVET
jgi:hypothetical protein